MAGKVWYPGLDGGHTVGVHFTVVHDVMLKSEVKSRIMAAVGGEKGLARELLLRCWNCTVSCSESWKHDLVQWLKLLPADYLYALIYMGIAFPSKCKNSKSDFSKDFETLIQVPPQLFLPPINLSN